MIYRKRVLQVCTYTNFKLLQKITAFPRCRPSIRPRSLLYPQRPNSLAFLTASSPTTAILSIPSLAIPIAFFRYCYLQDPNNTAHLETLIWTFLGLGTIGLSLSATIQGFLLKPLANALFGAQAGEYFEEFRRTNAANLSDAEKERRAQMAWRWQYFAFLFFFAFGLAGLVEEVLKSSAIILARRWGSVATEREYLNAAIAATLGFSTVENIAFVYAARNDSPGTLALTLLERVLLGGPAHTLSGCLLSLSIVRRDLRREAIGWVRILAWATLYHGAWDFSLLAICAANGNVGWVHPRRPVSLMAALGVAVGISAAAFWQVRSEMDSLGVVL